MSLLARIMMKLGVYTDVVDAVRMREGLVVLEPGDRALAGVELTVSRYAHISPSGVVVVPMPGPSEVQ